MKEKNFGTFLKYCRTACIITQIELAKKIGSNKHSVCAWELGKYLPAPDKYRELIAFFSAMEDKSIVPLPIKEMQAAYIQERSTLWGERKDSNEPSSRDEE